MALALIELKVYRKFFKLIIAVKLKVKSNIFKTIN